MKKVVVIHGPNLNLLGVRQPEIYGHETLEEINEAIKVSAKDLGYQLTLHQSNSESEIVEWLQSYRTGVAGVIINPAGFSYNSVAILDALLAMEVPIVEVHLSNLFKREEYRQRSLTAKGVAGIISGLGKHGYLLALQYLAALDPEKQQ